MTEKMKTKRCTKCTQTKPLSEFSLKANGHSRRNQCRTCTYTDWSRSQERSRLADANRSSDDQRWLRELEAKADARTQAAFDRLRADRLCWRPR
jgi:hypothetical protein